MDNSKKRQTPEMSDTDFFRLVYLPFIFIDVVWDYSDSIADVSKQMRINEIRKANYAVRDLRNTYDAVKRKFICWQQLQRHDIHVQQFQDDFQDIFSESFRLLRHCIMETDTRLTKEQNYYFACVFLTISLISALKKYSQDCLADLKKYYGSNLSTIIPKPVREYAQLLPQFLLGREDLVKATELAGITEKITDTLCSIKFTGEFNKHTDSVDIGPSIEIVASVYKLSTDTLLHGRSKAALLARRSLCVILHQAYYLYAEEIAKALGMKRQTVTGYLAQLPVSDGRIGECFKQLNRL